MNALEYALNFRHACKAFDPQKTLSEADLHFILDAARKAPSAFGLEPWHFLVIHSPTLKEKLRPVCWNQFQVTSCACFVVVLARKAHCFRKGAPYLGQYLSRQIGSNSTKQAELEEKVLEALAGIKDLDGWLKAQCSFSVANMLTAAAFLGVDSCPMEGFDAPAFEAILAQDVPEYNKQEYTVAMCVPLGYRAGAQTPQLRWPLSELVSTIR